MGAGAKWLAMTDDERDERRSRAVVNPDNPPAFALTVSILREQKRRQLEEAS